MYLKLHTFSRAYFTIPFYFCSNSTEVLRKDLPYPSITFCEEVPH